MQLTELTILGIYEQYKYYIYILYYVILIHVIIQWLANCWLHVYSWYIYIYRYDIPVLDSGDNMISPKIAISSLIRGTVSGHKTMWSASCIGRPDDPIQRKNMFCLPSSFGRGDSWFRIALQFFMTSGRVINYWMVFLLNIDIPIIPIPIAILYMYIYIYILYIDYIYTIYIHIRFLMAWPIAIVPGRPRADLRRHEFFRDMNFAAGYRRGFVGTQ